MGAARYRSVLIGAFAFPHGDASSNRLLSLAKTFREAGYQPLVLNDAKGSTPLANDGQVRDCDDVPYVCLRQRGKTRLGRLIFRTLRPFRVLITLRRLGLRSGQIIWISVAAPTYSVSLHLVLTYVFHSRVILDIVERHDRVQFVRGLRDPYLIRHRYVMWLARWLPHKLIVISTDLERCYSKFQPTFVLPPSIDAAEYVDHAPSYSSNVLEILYAGVPDRKDLLGTILRGIARLDDRERSRIRLTIAGLSDTQLACQPGVDRRMLAGIGEMVRTVGVKSRAEIHQYLRRSHFSILIRPITGYSTAGFPSKVPESLAAGCPVILNFTSDLQSYLRDGYEAIVCAGPGAVDVASALQRALGLSAQERSSMSVAARELAVSRFDYHVWASPLADFLGS